MSEQVEAAICWTVTIDQTGAGKYKAKMSGKWAVEPVRGFGNLEYTIDQIFDSQEEAEETVAAQIAYVTEQIKAAKTTTVRTYTVTADV